MFQENKLLEILYLPSIYRVFTYKGIQPYCQFVNIRKIINFIIKKTLDLEIDFMQRHSLDTYSLVNCFSIETNYVLIMIL